MLKRTVMQLSGRNMALFTQALAWLKALPCKLVSSLPVNFIQAYRSVANRRLLVVLTESNISLWRANLITVVQLIKAGLITVQVKASQIGSQLLTIVHQISQRVRTVLLQKIGKLVALIKLVQLRLNESKTALIRMAVQLTQAGLKLLDRAKQRLQRVLHLLCKGR